MKGETRQDTVRGGIFSISQGSRRPLVLCRQRLRKHRAHGGGPVPYEMASQIGSQQRIASGARQGHACVLLLAGSRSFKPNERRGKFHLRVSAAKPDGLF